MGRGADISADALMLGAHLYIDTEREDAAAVLQRMGGAQAIVATIGHAEAIGKLLPGLAPQGTLVVLGTGQDPLPVSASQLIGSERRMLGSLTGTPHENEKTLRFSVLTNVRPMIETMPLESANEAYQRMKSGAAKFRVVLTMGTPR